MAKNSVISNFGIGGCFSPPPVGDKVNFSQKFKV